MKHGSHGSQGSQGTNGRRPRTRGGKRPSSSRNVFDSNGPSIKVRGSAQQVLDKYLTLARDAQTSGDRVQAESYLQYAEHYYRVLNSDQSAGNQGGGNQGGGNQRGGNQGGGNQGGGNQGGGNQGGGNQNNQQQNRPDQNGGGAVEVVEVAEVVEADASATESKPEEAAQDSSGKAQAAPRSKSKAKPRSKPKRAKAAVPA